MAQQGGDADELLVVHVTDFHLYADEAHVNDGLVPAASCAAVLAAAAAAAPAPAAVVLTGDFTNDDSEASYGHLVRLVRAAWPAPTRVLFVPGCVRRRACHARRPKTALVAAFPTQR
jgi:Icc protein